MKGRANTWMLRGKPYAEWKSDILNSLDNNPMPFDRLAEGFGFKPGTEEYFGLMSVVSDLQAESEKVKPKLKTSHTEGTDLYPLYRTDQERQLINLGVLSKEKWYVVYHPLMALEGNPFPRERK